jgi:2-C-methyl-D-erythritol 4-phosphate cytidylyltransferase
MGETTAKQYLRIQDRTVIEYACDALLNHARIQSLVIAVQAEDQTLAGLPLGRDDRVQQVTGGAQRAESVLAGLDHLAPLAAESDWVLVHDAARPCLEISMVEQLLQQLSQHDVGGILAVPVTDTVKRADSDCAIQQTLAREQLWQAQTPQMFRYGLLRRALRRALEQDIAITDESMALELMGYAPRLVSGAASNIKVTYPRDLALAAWYIANRSIA